MPATESIARRYAADIGFAVVGELTRKPEWDGIANSSEIGLSGYCRVWVDEGGNADRARKLAEQLRSTGYSVDVWQHTKDGAQKTDI